MKELIDLDKKHFLHPTSSIQQQQEHGPKVIMQSGKGIHLRDVEGNQYIDAMSSLWNVHIGHGRDELADVRTKQMNSLAFSSAFSTFSHVPGIKFVRKNCIYSSGKLKCSFFHFRRIKRIK